MTPQEFAATFQSPLGPAQSYLLSVSDAQVLRDSVVAGHKPAVAPHYFTFEAWYPLPTQDIRTYAARFGFVIPAVHQSLLTQVNGLTYRRCSLYGIPPSLMAPTPLIDRTRRQPFDLGAANTAWRSGYAQHEHLFHLGGFWYSHQENAGLFLAEEGSVVAALKNGEQVREWPEYQKLIAWMFTRPETGV